VLTPVILIADHHNLFIEGLAKIVREKMLNMEIIGARSLAELLHHLEHTTPEIIFLNYQFISEHFHAIRPTLAKNGYPEIIAICDEPSEEARKRSASLGVFSVVGKDCRSEDIWQQLDRFSDFNPRRSNPADPQAIVLQSKTDTLTARQRNILQLLSCGLTNREISDRIGCAETTVKAHLNTAYNILGVKNRTQAMYVVSQMTPSSGTA